MVYYVHMYLAAEKHYRTITSLLLSRGFSVNLETSISIKVRVVYRVWNVELFSICVVMNIHETEIHLKICYHNQWLPVCSS